MLETRIYIRTYNYGLRGTPQKILTLSVVHIVDGVPVHFPCKVDRNETDDKPAEQDFKHGNSHVVGQPIVHKFGQKGNQTINHTGQEFKIPRFFHAVFFLPYILMSVVKSDIIAFRRKM